MIVDRVKQWQCYSSSVVWRQVFDFLCGLEVDAEEKKHNIQGEEIFASVMRYETIAPDESELEAHRKYADIQTLLTGSERIDWYPQEGLAVQTPYNEKNDVEFYQKPGPAAARVGIAPGRFALFFPQDAHAPQMMWGDRPELVTKVVVKINIDLLRV